MATLDIRADEQKVIVYADPSRHYDNSSKIVGNNKCDYLLLRDCVDRGSGLVMLKDIDNLILALQKAKELWGNK